jgi:hypothetical protein
MLPNGEEAVVEIEKLTQYCLSRSHPRGRHKARVFFAALAVSVEQAEELRAVLLSAASQAEATKSYVDEFGTRFVIDFIWRREDRNALIRSSWIIRVGDTIPPIHHLLYRLGGCLE